MADTAIEWATKVWNPLLGCERVSPGCDHCYAIGTATVRAGNPHPRVAAAFAGLTERRDGRTDWTGRVNLLPERLAEPTRWRKPQRVFVNSQSDLFHDSVPDEYIARVWQVMATTPRHTYQILTKRHARMRAWVNRCKVSPGGWITHDGTDPRGACDGTGIIVGYPEPAKRIEYQGPRGGQPRHKPQPVAFGWPLPNVWLGVSIENQQWADIRVPALLDTPAAVRWLSCEPLLGPVDLRSIRYRGDTDYLLDVLFQRYRTPGRPPTDGIGATPFSFGLGGLRGIDWIVVGGESGPGARPMHPDWARDLRDQCQAARLPFFFKQWGEWSPEAMWVHGDNAQAAFLSADGRVRRLVNGKPTAAPMARGEDVTMRRAGKKAAGRELDGRTWDEYPQAVTV